MTTPRRIAVATTLALLGLETALLHRYLVRSVDVIAHADPGWLVAAVAAALVS